MRAVPVAAALTKPLLVPGTANPPLVAALAAETGWDVADTDIRRFPDGEAYVRIGTPADGATVVVVQSTHPDAGLVELLLLQDAAREAGAGRVVSVVPYFGYARQDGAFRSGEAVSARVAARAIATTADALLVVDPHKEHILDFFGEAARGASAVGALAEELGRWGVDGVLAPDHGALERARQAATALGVPSDHLEKTRVGPSEVRMAPKELHVEGRRVAILDDMIASGGTMVMAARQLKQQGAKAVYAACTHGLFTDGAVGRLRAAGIDRVLCSDTLETGGCDRVTVAPAVATGLRTLL